MNGSKTPKFPRFPRVLTAFSLISLSFFGLFLCPGQAGAAAQETIKTRQLESGNLEYHLRLESNPRASYDGEAFRQQRGGTQTYVVVLNPAFFEKESKQIFSRLQRATNREPSPALLTRLVGDLDSLGDPKPAPGLREGLQELQTYLENLAWSELYKKCLAGADKPDAAFACFRDGFVQQRLATVEEHEVAHLIDLASRGDDGSDRFSRYTELNAFYAELLRGANPLDSMAQAFTGLIDEMQGGKVVDYSTEKVRRVLKFLETCPRYRALMAQAERPRCCLEILAQLSREDFSVAGRELQKQNQIL